MKTHEVCSLFPEMDGDDLADLARDIAENGLREPIVTHRGSVIDGRNRLRACEMAGVEPRFREWDGDGDLLAYVVSLNLHRRHLKVGQRAMLADEIATYRQGDNRRSDSANLRNLNHGEAAELVGVSPRSVESASVVRSNGTPKLVEAVKKGKVSVSAAETVATLPRPVQAAVVAEGPAAVKAKAAEVRKGKTKVNGVVVEAEPKHIAKLREAGRITGDVEITEPETNGVAVAEPEPEPEPEMGEEEWLASLPLSSRLRGVPLQKFRHDAASYRAIEKARNTFRTIVRREFKAVDRRFPRGDSRYQNDVRWLLSKPHPRDWYICMPPEKGGCGGTGQVPLIGSCPACHGRGYFFHS